MSEQPDRPWKDYHRDFRSVVDGKRYILDYEPAHGTVLRPWRDPKAAQTPAKAAPASE